MKKTLDIESYIEIKKVFEHICENILDIPKDTITIKSDGDRYGIFCKEEYFDEFSDYMMSLDGWEPKFKRIK